VVRCMARDDPLRDKALVNVDGDWQRPLKRQQADRRGPIQPGNFNRARWHWQIVRDGDLSKCKCTYLLHMSIYVGQENRYPVAHRPNCYSTKDRSEVIHSLKAGEGPLQRTRWRNVYGGDRLCSSTMVRHTNRSIVVAP